MPGIGGEPQRSWIPRWRVEAVSGGRAGCGTHCRRRGRRRNRVRALRPVGRINSPGAEKVAALIGLTTEAPTADILITGEGKFDRTSLDGKGAEFVLTLADKRGVAVAVDAGRAADVVLDPSTPLVTLAQLAGGTTAALADPAHWLRTAGAKLALVPADQLVE